LMHHCGFRYCLKYTFECSPEVHRIAEVGSRCGEFFSIQQKNLHGFKLVSSRSTTNVQDVEVPTNFSSRWNLPLLSTGSDCDRTTITSVACPKNVRFFGFLSGPLIGRFLSEFGSGLPTGRVFLSEFLDRPRKKIAKNRQKIVFNCLAAYEVTRLKETVWKI
jgi:hypothetical protein